MDPLGCGIVNLYDVLRLLISRAALPETVANDCQRVIDEVERWNALGTVTKTMEVEAHVHVYPPFSDVCTKCGRGQRE
jgi:hypothetical protein